MANRMKEDEKNEKIIRGLLKLPANKRCINCNNLGPQYVCTNFWTFICTNCSGAHREFTHRVKSVSMAKFTSQEVSSLQEGGNERAREIYFKDWDSQRHSFPDSSNNDRLRDFIRHVYVDRRYTGEKNVDKPPRTKGDREEYSENRRSEPYQGGLRSPPYDSYGGRTSYGGQNDEKNFRYAYGEKSPGYDQGDYRRSPRRFEVVDDRRRDKFGHMNPNQKLEDQRYPKKPEGGSPNFQKDADRPSPPAVRPIRDILGDDAPPLQVGEPPKSKEAPQPKEARVDDNITKAQTMSSSNSMVSRDGNSTQSKEVTPVSLIDFSAEPDPPAAAPPPHVSQKTNSPSADSGNWASFDAFSQQKEPQVTSVDSLESALAQLAIPGSASAGHGTTLPATAVDSMKKSVDGGQLPMMQQPLSSLFPSVNNQSPNSLYNVPIEVPNNQSIQGSMATPVSALAEHQSHIATKVPQETSNGVSAQPTAMASNSTGRKELPQDIFTSFYPSTAVSIAGWQRGPQLGYTMQYPVGMAMPAMPQPSQSVNPFDLANEPAVIQAPTFSNMASLQGASSNMSRQPTLMHSSSFGVSSPQFVPPQQLFHQLSYPSAMPPSQYMMQQVPSNMAQQALYNVMPVLSQGALAPGSVGPPFGASGMDQHSAPRGYSQPSSTNAFGSVGGNPFG
ncbi:uncharacterized protein [Typha angustifolia]|uniref:uncharacterized protein n=1 Tax=Typha angustifolia TaxID=59011 RepID=UPI003C2F5479